MESGAATDSRWSDPSALGELAAILDRNGYNLRRGEPGFGGTEPRDAEPCRCDPPGLYLDREDGAEVRCWKCGACPACRP